MEFRHQTLANGLEVVAECNAEAYSSGLAFFVRTGARDESDELSGVSHFLEHMVFKGTPTRSAEDVNRELDEIGSHSNAFTSEEQTVYYATVLPEYVERAVQLLADIMRPSLREDDFNTEKKVIIEEIYKYEDQPPFGAYEKCMAAYFGEHPLGRNILGTVESVTQLTPESMRDYFQHRYSPSNIVLAAAGCIDFDQLVALAERYCGAWQRTETSRQLPPSPVRNGFHVIEKETATQCYAVQISPGPSATDPGRYTARVMATILGDDSGSRMYWELVDTGLAEYAAMSPYEFQGAGVMMNYLCCAPEEVTQNLARMRTLLRKAEADGVTEEELERAKSKICSHIVLRSERPSSRLFSVGNSWIQRREYRSVKEVVEAYQQVTLQDVTQMLRDTPPSQGTTVVVGPTSDVQAPA